MKKGLVIGNSHVAMLISSLHENPKESSEVIFDFFACPGLGEQDVNFNGNCIYSENDKVNAFLDRMKMTARVDLSDYDFILVVACKVSILPILNILKSFRVWSWHKTDSLVYRRDRVISDDCFFTAVHCSIKAKFGSVLIRKIRAVSDIPIFFIPTPLPCESITLNEKNDEIFEKIESLEISCKVSEVFQKVLTLICGDLPKVSLVGQPPHTITGRMYSKRDFMRDSIRLFNLETQHPGSDTSHANRHYGDAIIQKVITLL